MAGAARSPDGSEHQIEEAAHRVEATIQALNLGQVEVLLAHNEWHDDRRAWFGPDPHRSPPSRERWAILGRGATVGPFG
jgi:hypothetical protein